jgi:hypothetical protein
VATVFKSTTADQIEAMAFVCCAMPRPWLPGLATVGTRELSDVLILVAGPRVRVKDCTAQHRTKSAVGRRPSPTALCSADVADMWRNREER